MTAPLPLRFYNPVKELCLKLNLDYETVIGVGMSPKMRETYINADIEKPLDMINSKDRKQIQHKKEFLDRKYGNIDARRTEEGTIEDKGCDRYKHGLIVEPILPDDCPCDKPETIQNSDGTVTIIKRGGSTKKPKWIPGRGIE